MSPTPDQRYIDALVNTLRRRSAPEPEYNGHATSPPMTDDEVIALCRRAKNAPKFARLFDDGDTGAYAGDDSDADMALIGILKFYTQDVDQLERLARRSALRRPKWNERRGSTTWIRHTINEALKNVTQTYAPDDGPSLNVHEGGENTETTSSSSSSAYRGNDDDGDKPAPGIVWFSKLGEPEERRSLVEDLMPEKYPTVMHGWSGAAKSILALLLGMVVSSSVDEWLGLKVNIHGPVLYLDLELDQSEQHRRVRDLAAGLGIAVPEKLAYISALGMSTRAAFELALEACKEHGVVLVIIDSLGPAMLGDMEAAKDVIKFNNDYIAPFRAAGTTVLIVDHQGKVQAGENYQQKGAFGSSYKEHLARSVIQVEAGDRDKDAGELRVRVRHKKSNFGIRRDPFDVKLTFRHGEITAKVAELEDTDLAAEATLNATERVERALRAGPAYPDELAERTGLAVGTVKNCLTQLKRQGKVEPTGEMQGKAQQVRLSSSSSFPYKGSDDDAAEGEIEI